VPPVEKSEETLRHLVSFRISEADYQVLLEACKRMKVGSISQVAREIICAFLSAEHDTQKLALSRSLRKVERDLTELLEELRSVK